MAKRIVKWTLDGSSLKLYKVINEKESELKSTYDMEELFEDFNSFNPVQKHTVVYGVKQILSDTGASDKGDADGKIESADSRWADLKAGKVVGERTNSTGAAEERRIGKLFKATANSAVISMESLMAKKLAYPATFTAEEDAKLKELLQRAYNL